MRGRGREIFGARITALPPGMKRGEGGRERGRIEGERGGNSESALSKRWKERERQREREGGRNGARTESEGGRWGRSLLRKLATWQQR